MKDLEISIFILSSLLSLAFLIIETYSTELGNELAATVGISGFIFGSYFLILSPRIVTKIFKCPKCRQKLHYNLFEGGGAYCENCEYKMAKAKLLFLASLSFLMLPISLFITSVITGAFFIDPGTILWICTLTSCTFVLSLIMSGFLVIYPYLLEKHPFIFSIMFFIIGCFLLFLFIFLSYLVVGRL